MSVVRDNCPLCGGRRLDEDSVAEPNLYSEKLAELVGEDEQRLIAEYSNWRCLTCGLIFKRRWFDQSVVLNLFARAVPMHPKGWDAVLKRFSAEGFERSVEEWAGARQRSAEPAIRRGERELTSIVQSIPEPIGFDPSAAVAAIKAGDVDLLKSLSGAVIRSISEPAPFTRFAAFRSRPLWDYLQERTGGFEEYAEVGCPLWGLLDFAADSGLVAVFLERNEPNYWGRGCVNDGIFCTARLLKDRRISRVDWDSSRGFPLMGLFQYLDHVAEPRHFLESAFDKAGSLAVILDGIESPVAIQHMTGWTEPAMAFVSDMFGKVLHTDFDEIRPSGNVLYLLAESPIAR